MSNITDFLKTFPALWMMIGAVLIGVIFYVVNRKVLSLSRDAQALLVDSYKERVSVLQTERDEYKNGLHALRNEHQSAKIKLAEQEARPDLTAVFRAYQDEADKRFAIYGQQTGLIADIGKSLERTAAVIEKMDREIEEHDKHVEDRLARHLEPITSAVQGTAEAMQALVAELRKLPPRKRRVLPSVETRD